MSAATNRFSILDDICKYQRPGSDKRIKEWCGKPYWRDGRLYAIDGAIAARVPCSLDEALAAYGDAATRKAMPPRRSWIEKPVTVTYDDVAIATRQYDVLMKCCEIGRVSCGECIDGLYPIYRAVKILGREPKVWFGAWYLAILSRHGVTSLKIERFQNGTPAFFAGDGFEGVLTPLVDDGSFEPDAAK